MVVGLKTGVEAGFGDPELPAFWRSAMKPFQALPLVADGAAHAFGFGPEDLALACASHGGTAMHVDRARAMLERIGTDVQALICGPHAPFDGASAERILREGGTFTRLHNNCSGKHTGLLALARHHGWPLQGYERMDHPVQLRLRGGLSPWLDTDPDELTWSVDGCGVPTPYLPLRAMARAYARLVAAAREGEPAPRAVVEAMTSHPELTSSASRTPLVLMQATRGRLLAKEGAEGVLCVAAPREGWALALKIVDGRRRAVGPAAVEMLVALDLLDGEELIGLEEQRHVPVRDTRGQTVGVILGEVEPHLASAPAGGVRPMGGRSGR